MDIRNFFGPKKGDKSSSNETKNKKLVTPEAKKEDNKNNNGLEKTKPQRTKSNDKKLDKSRQKSGDKKKSSVGAADDSPKKVEKSNEKEQNGDKSKKNSDKADKKEVTLAKKESKPIKNVTEKKRIKNVSSSDNDDVIMQNDEEDCKKTKKKVNNSSTEDEVKGSKKEKKTSKILASDSEEVSPLPKKGGDKKVNKTAKKKSRILFDSDSEEESPVPKKSKKKKEPVIFLDESDDEDSRKPKVNTLDAFVMNTPTPKKVVKKKDEKKAAISVNDFFGGDSVKRIERTPSTKRKSSEVDKDLEIHEDDDFLDALEQLDAAQTPKRVKLDKDVKSTSPTKPTVKPLSPTKPTIKTPSPEKPDKKPSPAKPSVTSSKVSKSPEKQNEKSSLAKKLADKAKTSVSESKISPKKTSPTVGDNNNNNSKQTKPVGTPTNPNRAGYRSYLNREGPSALGSKEIPEGAENCLEGLTFVLTGVYESIERDEAKSLVEKYGGKATTSLSKITDYIVVGRDAGESKMNKANQFGTKQLDEDALLNLIKTRPGKKSKYTIQAEKSFKQEQSIPKTPVSTHKIKSETCSDSNSKASSSSKQPSASDDEPVLLWVDKHRPISMKTIIGQQGDKSNAKKLCHWLKSWHKNRAAGTKPAGKFFNKANDDGSSFKAALLSGPPGVGKTTTATVVCKESGFSYVELNASDTRSKKSLQTEVAESLNNHSLVDFMGSTPSTTEGQKHCLIMDEVDGMAGNADRGGLQELVSLIKTSKIPVLCICNDRNSMKMRTLSNYCFDLRFYKPRLEQIKGAMMSLAFKEGIKITPPAMNEIILAANQDIRQVIHNLSVWSAVDKGVSYEQAKKDSKSAQKDFKIGPFEVCRKVFVGGEETNKMTLHDKSDLFFNDYSIAPLFVQENYPTVIPYSARGNIKEHLRLLSKTADTICDGDLVDKLIRKEGVWSLLPMQAMYASVIPGELMRGSFQQMVAFPSWLGKNSSTGKTDRLLAELSMHMRLQISGDKRSLNMDYLPVLRNSLTHPLTTEGASGVPSVIKLMDEYDITKDDFDNILDVSKWPNSSDPLNKLETKTKAAFTRTYNKESHLTPYATGAAPKKKKGGKAEGNDDEDGLLKMEDEEGEKTAADGDDSDNDNIDNDTMIKMKTASSSKGKTAKPSEKVTAKGKGKGKKGK